MDREREANGKGAREDDGVLAEGMDGVATDGISFGRQKGDGRRTDWAAAFRRLG